MLELLEGTMTEECTDAGTMPSCVITWTIEDIHNLRESSELAKWTDDQAGSFLESISRLIEDRSTELGWEIITDAMPDSDLGSIDLP